MGDWTRHDGLLDRLEETEQQIAFWQAQQLHALAELAADPLPFPSMAEADEKRWVSEEAACVLKVCGATAAMRMSIATDAVAHYGEAVKLLEAGQISQRHVWALVDTTRHLHPEHKRAVLDRVLDRLPDQSLTNFKRCLDRAVLAVDPASAEEQHQLAAADRKVTIRHGQHGMSALYAELPTPDATAIYAALDARARTLAGSDGEEARTLDNLRADVLTDSVCGSGDARTGAAIQVCIALSTLTGADDEPGEADGQPISASQARLLAFDKTSTWRRLLTDERGVLLDYGRTTYRPPAPLATFVKARDRVCTFPHCNRPATRCDLDHRTDWAHGGTTNACNLHPLCERHHNAKHQAGWTVRLLENGTTRWISPTRRSYDKPPATYPVDRTVSAPADQPGDGAAPF